MDTSSSAKSWAAMTVALVVQDAAFKNCCLRSGRYDGANRNHFFPRVVSKQFLWAEELGLSLEMTNPTFTNLSAVQSSQRVGSWRHAHRKENQYGYQLCKALQPPRDAAVAANPGFDPGSQLEQRL